jgi:hypothetical protein
VRKGPCVCATDPYCKGLCKSCYYATRYRIRNDGKPRQRRAPAPPDCHPDRKHEAQGMCEPCYKAFLKRSDPERFKAYGRTERAKRRPRTREAIRRSALRLKFGITPEQYDAMAIAQGGVCALCQRPERTLAKRLAVDHCHATGLVRELLCGPCNVVLGYIENPEWYQRALAYLAKHRARGAA